MQDERFTININEIVVFGIMSIKDENKWYFYAITDNGRKITFECNNREQAKLMLDILTLNLTEEVEKTWVEISSLLEKKHL